MVLQRRPVVSNRVSTLPVPALISADTDSTWGADPPETRRSVTAVGRHLRPILQGAWRRRFLLIIPVLLMLPISVVAAKLLPVPYEARTLLLLQEPGRGSPLMSDSAASSDFSAQSELESPLKQE